MSFSYTTMATLSIDDWLRIMFRKKVNIENVESFKKTFLNGLAQITNLQGYSNETSRETRVVDALLNYRSAATEGYSMLHGVLKHSYMLFIRLFFDDNYYIQLASLRDCWPAIFAHDRVHLLLERIISRDPQDFRTLFMSNRQFYREIPQLVLRSGVLGSHRGSLSLISVLIEAGKKNMSRIDNGLDVEQYEEQFDRIIMTLELLRTNFVLAAISGHEVYAIDWNVFAETELKKPFFNDGIEGANDKKTFLKCKILNEKVMWLISNPVPTNIAIHQRPKRVVQYPSSRIPVSIGDQVKGKRIFAIKNKNTVVVGTNENYEDMKVADLEYEGTYYPKAGDLIWVQTNLDFKKEVGYRPFPIYKLTDPPEVLREDSPEGLFDFPQQLDDAIMGEEACYPDRFLAEVMTCASDDKNNAVVTIRTDTGKIGTITQLGRFQGSPPIEKRHHFICRGPWSNTITFVPSTKRNEILYFDTQGNFRNLGPWKKVFQKPVIQGTEIIQWGSQKEKIVHHIVTPVIDHDFFCNASMYYCKREGKVGTMLSRYDILERKVTVNIMALDSSNDFHIFTLADFRNMYFELEQLYKDIIVPWEEGDTFNSERLQQYVLFNNNSNRKIHNIFDNVASENYFLPTQFGKQTSKNTYEWEQRRNSASDVSKQLSRNNYEPRKDDVFGYLWISRDDYNYSLVQRSFVNQEKFTHVKVYTKSFIKKQNKKFVKAYPKFFEPPKKRKYEAQSTSNVLALSKLSNEIRMYEIRISAYKGQIDLLRKKVALSELNQEIQKYEIRINTAERRVIVLQSSMENAPTVGAEIEKVQNSIKSSRAAIKRKRQERKKLTDLLGETSTVVKEDAEAQIASIQGKIQSFEEELVKKRNERQRLREETVATSMGSKRVKRLFQSLKL